MRSARSILALISSTAASVIPFAIIGGYYTKCPGPKLSGKSSSSVKTL